MQNGKINYWTKQQTLEDREAALRQKEEDMRRKELQLANMMNRLNDTGSTQVNNELHKLTNRVLERVYNHNPLRPLKINLYQNKTPISWNSSKVKRTRAAQTYLADSHRPAFSEDVQPSLITPSGKLRSPIKKINPFRKPKFSDANPPNPPNVGECLLTSDSTINPRAAAILKAKAERTKKKHMIEGVASAMRDEYGRVVNDTVAGKTLNRPTMKDYSKQYSTEYSSESDRGINMTVDLPKPAVPLPRIKVDMDATMSAAAETYKTHPQSQKQSDSIEGLRGRKGNDKAPATITLR